MRNLLLPIACCLLLIFKTAAQLPMPLNIKAAFDKGTRSMDGKPGKNYWQNTANYNIKVNFDPATRLLSGEEEIIYVNNSPDTLKIIVFKLHPNLYRRGAIRMMPVDTADETMGISITNMKANGKIINVSSLDLSKTVANIPVDAVAPKQTITFAISFSYTLNKKSHIRTGQVDEGSYFIAYFFPRIAVYDDIDGWDRSPYLGTLEFYNDFGDFNVEITTPKDFLVWATGELQNCETVFYPIYCRLIAKAERNDEIIIIIDSSDIQKRSITRNGDTSNRNAINEKDTGQRAVIKPTNNTWKFHATNVTDFVFALSDHYLWYSTSVEVDKKTKRRTRVDAVFNPTHKDYFQVVHDARKTVEAMSFVFPKWPFPYSHETVFDGLDQMEYPMMVNDNPVEDRAESIELTDHEIFHTMFPFYMGINERKYAWMDEGWATIGEWIISPLIDSTIVDEYGVSATSLNAGKEIDLPIMTISTQLNGAAYFINSYPKPAMGYLYVKDMLGDSLFHKALHFYIDQWKGKHPIPNDFFNAMNKGSGKNINWFWKKWFYETGFPDLAVKKITETGNIKQIVIESVGNKPVPVHLTVTFNDGTTQNFHQSISAWEKGNRTVTIKLNTSKKIKKVVLNHPHVPDADAKNNSWER